MRLSITNNTTKRVIYDEIVEDLGGNRNFYKFSINLPSDVEDGEYTYDLYNENELIATGLIQVGDYKNDNFSYKNNKKEYISYNG